MKYRIVTHGNCTDGYCSAFVVKRFFNDFFGTKLTDKQIQEIPVIGAQPYDLQEGKFSFNSGDIVLDLPHPKGKVLFWCDHHSSNEQKGNLPEGYFWKVAPSCTGFLIELAQQQGTKADKELLQFKRAIDINDSAGFTKEEIKDIFYKQKSYARLSPLQKLAAIGAMFNTRDRNLNEEIFRTLLTRDLGNTPLSSPSLWQLNPLMYHKAQLESYQQWRDNVDTYVYYDPEAKCVVQDDRMAKINIGIPDRFYVYMKQPHANYSLNLRLVEEKKARLGIGSNIFHKERCQVDIGALCQEIGKKFGGSGGGHYYVGGVVIRADKADEAIEFILEKFKNVR